MKQISIELIHKVANYLASKPYIETVQLINELSQLPDVPKGEVKIEEKK